MYFQSAKRASTFIHFLTATYVEHAPKMCLNRKITATSDFIYDKFGMVIVMGSFLTPVISIHFRMTEKSFTYKHYIESLFGLVSRTSTVFLSSCRSKSSTSRRRAPIPSSASRFEQRTLQQQQVSTVIFSGGYLTISPRVYT